MNRSLNDIDRIDVTIWLSTNAVTLTVGLAVGFVAGGGL